MGAPGSRRHLPAVPFNLGQQERDCRNLRDTKVSPNKKRNGFCFSGYTRTEVIFHEKGPCRYIPGTVFQG